jgi:phage terminase large subunit
MAEAALQLPELDVRLPEKLEYVFSGPARTRGAHGGRGSGKSRGFALMAAIRAISARTRILCARELQTSIRYSVHQEIVEAIEEHGLASMFDYGESFIRCPATGSEFLFKGLRHNYREIKGLSGIDLAWVEEAEVVSEESWRVLIPTIRKPGSELWVTWNPEVDGSATDVRFRKKPPPTPEQCAAQGLDPSTHAARIVEMNFDDNPWFPDELDAERQRDLKLDADLYAWVWEGDYRRRSDAQVLNGKWRVAEFEPGPEWDGPYHGLDWGFSQDPTAGVRCWVHGRTLYIEHDASQVKLGLDATGDFLRRRIPGIEDFIVRADNARPESIAHVRTHERGLPRIEAVRKWPGSVEDGVEHLRAYDEIVIHPRCEATRREAKLWSFKVDRNTGDVLPTLVDAHNHCWDAVRYALAPLIRKRNAWGAA